MKQTRLMMDMPITIEISDSDTPEGAAEPAFAFFAWVDETFSPYRPDSELSRINDGRLTIERASEPMRAIFQLAEETRQDTGGYFDIRRGGSFDPSGIVKGWAIHNAALLMRRQGYASLSVDAGGDIQVYGESPDGGPWRVGIRSPFAPNASVKTLALTDCGVATSGRYFRGEHIYNPLRPGPLDGSVASLTVIGPNIYEADRFATAAFAMGGQGVDFIEGLEGFEAYQIDGAGIATLTTGFTRYVAP
jgi:thiamine biosynthesis lipoprotein